MEGRSLHGRKRVLIMGAGRVRLNSPFPLIPGLVIDLILGTS